MVRISNFSKYLDIKNCLYEKRLFSKFVLTSEDKLNTTETSLVDKKISLVKNSLPYYTNSLVIIWLYAYYYLLFIFSISFYYYYTRHLIKKNRNYCINIKINSVKEIYVKNLFFFWLFAFLMTNKIKMNENPYKNILIYHIGYFKVKDIN